MGGRRESVPEVIFFSFAKLFLAWERGTSANELSFERIQQQYGPEEGLRVQGLRKFRTMA